MKSVSSAISASGVRDGWCKVGSYGYNEATRTWCTQELIANKGIPINIPHDLAGGYYLVRPEVLALQDADKKPQIHNFTRDVLRSF